MDDISDLQHHNLGELHDVPEELGRLPDGHETLVVGDVDGCKDFNHPQGDNMFGFRGTCGLVSVEDVLKQFGITLTENDVVFAGATRGLCNTQGPPDSCGGTTEMSQAQLLSDLGVPAHMEGMHSLEQLADRLSHGQAVITEVNAGILWNEASALGNGGANHAIVVTGFARDPSTGELQGFYINDSGRGLPEDSGRFIPVEQMEKVWLEPGGTACVTDISRYA